MNHPLRLDINSNLVMSSVYDARPKPDKPDHEFSSRDASPDQGHSPNRTSTLTPALLLALALPILRENKCAPDPNLLWDTSARRNAPCITSGHGGQRG